MNKCLLFVSIVVLASACTSMREPGTTAPQASSSAPTTVQFAGGNGESKETAIVILGAKNEDEGVAAERRWFSEHMPGWSKSGQALIPGKKAYDVITLRAANGKERQIYFDITVFFGKF